MVSEWLKGFSEKIGNFLYIIVYINIYKEYQAMYTLEQLEKQQIGLRLPQYMIDEIDEFTQQFSVNRTDIVMEALRSYITEQKANLLYEKELLKRSDEVKSGKVKPISRDEAFDGI